RRTRMVAATAAMLMSAIWPGVSANSRASTGISGALANQAKKQTKNAIHVRWKARMGTVRKLNRSTRLAFSDMASGSWKWKWRPDPHLASIVPRARAHLNPHGSLRAATGAAPGRAFARAVHLGAGGINPMRRRCGYCTAQVHDPGGR